MANKQYIGARYVPKFYEGSNGNEWDSGVTYEPLTIVQYLNDSYTSKKPVPSTIGSPNNNPEYWARTGAYNAQVEEYREAVEEISEEFDDFDERLTTVENKVDYWLDEAEFMIVNQLVSQGTMKDILSPQCHEFVTIDGVEYMFAGFTNDSNGTNQIVKVRVSDGAIITYRDNVVSNCHFNDITYCEKDGYLYCAPLNSATGIIVLDLNCNFIRRIVITNRTVHNIAWDNEHEVFYVCFYGESSNAIYKYDHEFNLIQSGNAFLTPTQGRQSLTYHDGALIMTIIRTTDSFRYPRSNAAYVFDIETLEVVHTIKIPYKFEVGSLKYCNTTRSWWAMYNVAHRMVFMQGTIQSSIPSALSHYNKSVSDKGFRRNIAYNQVLFNANNDSWLIDQTNGHGIPTLDLLSGLYFNNINGLTITLESDMDELFVWFPNNGCSILRILGNNHSIHGMAIRNVPNVVLQNIVFDRVASNEDANVAAINTNRIEFNGCTFTSNNSDFGLRVNEGSILIGNCTFNGTFNEGAVITDCASYRENAENVYGDNEMYLRGEVIPFSLNLLKHGGGLSHPTVVYNRQETARYDGLLTAFKMPCTIHLSTCFSTDLPSEVGGGSVEQDVALEVVKLTASVYLYRITHATNLDWVYERIVSSNRDTGWYKVYPTS